MTWRLASVASVSVLYEKQPGFYLITAMGSATRRSLKSWQVRAAATLRELCINIYCVRDSVSPEGTTA
ncbi:MAG: hypothetical protein DMG88_24230 [Acidobacteria bacterium]|nr:MAG: hypothetical protein DMG88_24230 [Acidobacteriota bacterium]